MYESNNSVNFILGIVTAVLAVLAITLIIFVFAENNSFWVQLTAPLGEYQLILIRSLIGTAFVMTLAIFPTIIMEKNFLNKLLHGVCIISLIVMGATLIRVESLVRHGNVKSVKENEIIKTEPETVIEDIPAHEILDEATPPDESTTEEAAPADSPIDDITNSNEITLEENETEETTPEKTPKGTSYERPTSVRKGSTLLPKR